jgi:hypothetical protein
MNDIVLRSEDSDAMLDVDARLVMVHSSRLYLTGIWLRLFNFSLKVLHNGCKRLVPQAILQ